MAYCTSCGSSIPDDQGGSCSMCYGDIDHGSDRYYRREMERREYEEQMQREQSVREFFDNLEAEFTFGIHDEDKAEGADAKS